MRQEERGAGAAKPKPISWIARYAETASYGRAKYRAGPYQIVSTELYEKLITHKEKLLPIADVSEYDCPKDELSDSCQNPKGECTADKMCLVHLTPKQREEIRWRYENLLKDIVDVYDWRKRRLRAIHMFFLWNADELPGYLHIWKRSDSP